MGIFCFPTDFLWVGGSSMEAYCILAGKKTSRFVIEIRCFWHFSEILSPFSKT